MTLSQCLYLFTSFAALTISFHLSVPRKISSRLHSTMTIPWWSEKSEGLSFKCTGRSFERTHTHTHTHTHRLFITSVQLLGCGKCCQNDGEVWFDASEFSDVSDYMNITLSALLDGYTESIIGGWAKMKNRIEPDPCKPDRCIFLAEDGKTCSIYSVRPNQCRTYPW